MKNKIITITILTIIFLLPTISMMAQILPHVPVPQIPSPVDFGAGSGAPSLPSSAPVDGGLSLLIAGGVGYGVKKMKSERLKGKREK